MSYANQAVAEPSFRGRGHKGDTQSEGERFTPLCTRAARKLSTKRKQRGDEAFSAICFPRWDQD
jgi:hypothetical protein